jgi:hypothetical protein
VTSQEEIKLRCEIIERYGEDSEEYRAHRRHAAAEDERTEFGGKALAVGFFIVLALLQFYFFGSIGGNGYGRATADAYDWMEEHR